MAPKNPHPQAQVTQKTFVSGTPSYMAPEQCLGKATDERTDIYSLGCIIFELLTGQTLFNGITALEIFAKQIQANPPTLSAHAPDLDFKPELQQFMNSMLAKEPEKRFPNMRIVKQELQKLAQLH